MTIARRSGLVGLASITSLGCAWLVLRRHSPARTASSAVRLRLTLAVGRLLGCAVGTLAPWRRAVVRDNLRRLTSTSASHLPALEQRAYIHLCQALVLSLSAGTWLDRHLEPPQLSTLLADLQAGGVLMCSAHLGMWELVPQLLAPFLPEHARRHGLIVYRPLHNTRLDRWLLRRRQTTSGVALLPDHGARPAMRRALRAGGLVGMLPDQRPSHAGVPATLLGHAVEFSPGLATLHQDTGAPVWFALLLLDGAVGSSPPRLRFHLARLTPRVEPMPTERIDGRDGASGAALVRAYADALSDAIESHPEQFFWWHRRFAPGRG